MKLKSKAMLSILMSVIYVFIVLAGSGVPVSAAEGAITITEQPANYEGDVGEYVTFSVAATGNNLTYEWFYKNPGDASFRTAKVYTSSTRWQLTAARDGRQMYCVIKDSAGNQVQSDTATMSIKTAQPSAPITIVTQPADYTGSIGDNVTFSVVATGSNLTYEWFYKNPSDSSFRTAKVYTNSTKWQLTAARDGRQMYCVIRDDLGNSIQTNTATMSVGTAVPVFEITKQPETYEGAIGDMVTFTVTASGSNLTYEWFYKNPGDSAFRTAKVYTASTKWQLTAARDGRQMYCVVKDGDGNSIQSEVATMRVKTAAVALEITQEPMDYQGSVGDMVTFTVVASGSNLTYEWFYKNPADSSFRTAKVYTASTQWQLTAARDGRQMYCVVRDGDGNSVQSEVATMSVKAPEVTLDITSQPEDYEGAIGDMVTFTVAATGSNLTYEWFYKNPGDSAFRTAKVYTASTRWQLTAGRDGRQMYCVVKDGDGNSIQSEVATMSVKAPEVALEITSQPEDYEGEIGDMVTFIVVATGNNLTYEWFYKNPGDSAFRTAKVYTASTRWQLTAGRDGRQMYCVVKDGDGNSVQSEVATMSVKVPAVELAITSQPQDYEGEVGEMVTFTVEAVGENLTYEWFYKNPSDTTFRTAKVYTASTKWQLTEARNGRQMYCIVTDGDGNSIQSDIATMSVKAPAIPLEITSEPEDYLGRVGDMVTFTVEATGSDLSYEWFYKNPGDATFRTAKVYTDSTSWQLTAGRNGRQMYCVIKDGSGATVQTRTATMRVEVIPTVTIESSLPIITEQEDVTFTATATNAVSYQWYIGEFENDMVAVEGATSASYTYTAQTLGTIFAKCVVTSATNNTAESNVVIVEVMPYEIIPEVTITASENSVVEGDSVTFTAEATNTEAYQWYLGTSAENMAAVEGETNATFTYTTETVGNVYAKCVVTSSTGNTAESDIVVVEVAVREIIPYVYFEDANTCMMQGGTLILVPTDVENAETYQWYFGTSMDNLIAVEGETGSSFSYTAESAGTVYVKCVVTSATGNTAESNIVSILVEPLMILPTVTIEASAESVQQGDAVTFTATAENAESYQWYVDGVAVEGATEATFTYITENAGTIAVKCVVASATGNTSESMVVAIEVEPLMIVPTVAIVASATSVQLGHTVTFTATAENAESYQWYKGTSAESMTIVEGETAATYVLTDEAAGVVYVQCVVTSSTDNTANSNVVTVVILDEDEVPIVPGGGEECEHTNVTYTDNHDGTHTVHCTECNRSWFEACKDSNNDGKCDHCGHSMVVDRDEDETEIIGPSSGNGNDLREPNETEIL